MTDVLRTAVVARTPTASATARSRGRDIPRWWWAAKRAIDIGVSLSVLIVTLPVTLTAMAGIIVVSGGSPIFTQDRVGRDGRIFRLFKLRTMFRGAHLLHNEMRPFNEVEGPVFKMRDDPRLHPLGGWLRRTSIDELPNFLNVLRGEMSTVGPRPPLPCEVENYDEYARRRLTVKPGVTCLWQISGRSHITFEQWMALDNAYIDTWSPRMDLAIIARTVPAVLHGTGAH